MTRACSPRHRRWCNPWHARLVLEYRDARDAREAMRESGTLAPAGFGHVAVHQLEDDDFAEAFPPVTFRDWLIAHAHGGDQ